jgi:hypothetical protein
LIDAWSVAQAWERALPHLSKGLGKQGNVLRGVRGSAGKMQRCIKLWLSGLGSLTAVKLRVAAPGGRSGVILLFLDYRQ